ncbi:hypothetical protein RJ641_034047 [Dillenia turbinata]|uniref:DUF7755 domain-containing protein n=1 Tax=Dillenia turbinata TaxID=194707 RepID=A0AAN8W0X5_9MAGN
MESVCLRHVISASGHFPVRRYPVAPCQLRVTGVSLSRFCLVVSSRKSDFQDFQVYAKPSRLLPATEVKVWTPEVSSTSLPIDSSHCLYRVNIQTSSIYGSGLSDMSAGILLCLVDADGNAILQRIPATLIEDHLAQSEDVTVSDLLHFQRRSVDEFIFKGPKLGKIEALWISVESGQWRLGGVSLGTVSGSQTSMEETPYVAFQYEFEVEDILLGEGSYDSMVELRPRLVTKFSGVDPNLLCENLGRPTLLASHGISNEEGMKEYSDLKFSLLLYDAVFIFLGTSIASSVGENSAAVAFLTGGISGFLYLLLLQRSVDELPAPALSSSNGNQLFGGFKGPILSLAFALGLVFLAAKNSSGDIPVVLTPKDLIAGLSGFLACKVAVVLAAFKPLPIGLKNK